MELRLDAGRPNITVKSTQKSGFCNEDSCDHKKCNKTCIAFITFSYPRLKFLAHLEISQEAFGATLKNAVICDGFIIAIHANKTAKLYSLDYVLNKYMQQSYKIGESRSSQRMSFEESAIFYVNLAYMAHLIQWDVGSLKLLTWMRSKDHKLGICVWFFLLLNMYQVLPLFNIAFMSKVKIFDINSRLLAK